VLLWQNLGKNALWLGRVDKAAKIEAFLRFRQEYFSEEPTDKRDALQSLLF